MTRRALERRDSTRPLRVVNVASLAGYYPMPIKATYAASKRFVLDLSLALRHEFDPRDATFTVLAPAGLPTNPVTVRSIAAQGIWGELTTRNVGPVAARTIDLALAGRAVYIPGAVNQVMRAASAVLPAQWVASFIGRRWRSVRGETPGHGAPSRRAAPASQLGVVAP
jgi:short-subunit dehydrogenase